MYKLEKNVGFELNIHVNTYLHSSFWRRNEFVSSLREPAQMVENIHLPKYCYDFRCRSVLGNTISIYDNYHTSCCRILSCVARLRKARKFLTRFELKISAAFANSRVCVPMILVVLN